MRNFPVDGKRLVRDDAVSRQLLTSKSTTDLLPRAIPCMQRRASAESSAGWVAHEELLSRRQSTRCKRSFLFAMPKLMSSFDVPVVEDTLQLENEEEDDYSTARQGIDITPLPSSTASAAITPTGASTSVEARRSTGAPAATAEQRHASAHAEEEVAALLACAFPRGALLW